ncbi:MAG: serine--tRNA ligase [Calditrichaeota bacterium]|nr:serine--tRNA ligase [Calditrichota bacterium]
MLDLKFIRQFPDKVKENIKKRNDSVDIDALLKLDEERRNLETDLSTLKALRNKLSPQIGQMIKAGEDVSKIKAEVQEANQKIKTIEPLLTEVQEKLDAILYMIPNICHPESPVGGESANKVIKEWGNKTVFDFPVKDHKQLGTLHDIIDEERAVKVSGSGFIAVKGKGARLERALINFFLDTHTEKNGFTEIVPPVLVNSDSMFGTSQLPKFKDQSYYIVEDDLFVIPTAEVPVTNLHRDETLQEKQLPISYCAYTPCFRREAGSYGTGVKGFLRTHQFNKVEMVKITHEDESENALQQLVTHATDLLEQLNIPYRVLDLATGDMGFGASRCFDIEVWSPAENKYLEASSCSNFLDFQSRRLNLRYKKKDGTMAFAHTLNGSGLATSRLYVALLENNQDANGNIIIPEVLHQYTGFKSIEKNAV